MINNTRTQILLPSKLREEIEKARRARGESLAEYLRKAVWERLERERKKRANYRNLAREVIGSIKESSWKGVDVKRWQKELRQDR